MQDLRVLNLSRRKKNIILLLVDISIIMLVYATLALLNIEDINLTTGIWINIGIAIITYVFLLKVNNMYSCIWVNAGAYEFTQTIVASISACIVVTWITLIIPNTMSVLSNILAGILIMVALTGVRLSLRVLTRIVTYSLADRTDGKYNILIIGAGDCASTIISEIRKEKSNDYNIIGIIDDNKAKLNTLLNGVKVLGNRDNIVEIVERENIDQILFAIAKIDGEAKSKILDICSKTTAKVKVIPGYYQLLEEGISVNKMRDVDLRDLIGREEVKLDKSGIEKYINNKIVLVTGGGGSIGSELCRQIAKFNPKLLLILDIYENNAYDLQNELSYNEPNLNKKVIIASVRDKARLGQIISAYKPNIIFHAAAHKHVPLMEDNPSEAIKNNVIGTLNMAQLASQYKCYTANYSIP